MCWPCAKKKKIFYYKIRKRRFFFKTILKPETATEMQNNFGRYLNLVLSGQEIIVTKNGKEVGRFIPKDSAISYLTDSLTGILKGDYDLDKEKAERLKEKYEITD